MDQRPLRILYHHRIAASDGMRVHITEVVAALRSQGHLVCVVGPTSADEAQTAGASSQLERATDLLRRRLPPAVFELLELTYNIPAYLRLRSQARAFRPDVLYERYNLFLLAGLLLRRRHRLPMLLEVNSPLAAERGSFGKLQLTSVARACETALWRGADAVLPVTEVLAAEVRRARVGPEGVHVIANGADPRRFPAAGASARLRRDLGLPTAAVVLGFVGFVRDWHGVGWAVEALPRLPPEVHLLIVGDGPSLPHLQARAEALGVSARLHCVGRVPHPRVAAYTQAFDIALQTASTPYASPLKLFEYMALGRAIIAPDQPNIREVLADGRNALLFTVGCQASFAAALLRLCGDIALRRELGAEARRTVEQTPYTWAHNAGRIAALARAARTTRAFSSEVGSGSRKENAQKQKPRAPA
ncbi:glycosyltransferase involved in cell wall biosynthesis [Caulobacter rhizosphaerae]|uniref:Glycosyltransferase involved in cell wall biosynthesis n=1 Tax=Caulobacter rhizosphaerae TaxID=2010972 RepID=A0ABU1N1E4_9CAUL|nr:glycosyltransferase family 4 protein [Caulobacter rhizosphaerae]MDR6532272.1 glycosyltransferase involved in cell wall biosynthesis [Caulobacter rhizosphaerae]